MEKALAYWCDATVVAEDVIGGRVLRVLVANPAKAKSSIGEVCCDVDRQGDAEGTFILKRDSAGVFVTGYLMPSVGDIYRFDRLDLAPSATWHELLAVVRDVLSRAFNFPAEWNVRRQHFTLPKPP